ncbi:MAG: hypothetical protein V4534_03690 [Myxococcota bacterium]
MFRLLNLGVLLGSILFFTATSASAHPSISFNWGNRTPNRPYVAYAGQACSNFPRGPHCAPGLMCVGNMGYGICQMPYRGGRGGRGGHGIPNGHANGGGFWRR